MVPWRPQAPALPPPSSSDCEDESPESPERERRVSRRTSGSLPSELPAELIRGVPLEVCLQWWGTHWAPNDRDDYGLSQRSDSIDFFLSHDWKTSRWSKTLALLMFFNGVPAGLATVCASILSFWLLLEHALPGGWPTASISTYCTFLMVFCFWQRIRRLLCCYVPTVFLDRLCIAQHDLELKRQGILGLAGFLGKSRQLVILWTPRTFSRLWCTFELAQFLGPGSGRPVTIVPVAMMQLLMSVFIANGCLWAMFHVWLYIEESDLMGLNSSMIWIVLLASAFLAPVLIFCWVVQVSFGMQHLRDLSELDFQMQKFSIRNSECACCTFGHVDPAGNPMLCDRSLVYTTLRRWYGGDGEDHLDRFDAAVREHVRVSVMEGLGSGIPPVRFILVVAVVSPLGLLPQYLHMGLNGLQAHGGVSEDWKFWQWLVFYLHVPFVTLFLCWLGVNAPRVGLALSLKVRKWKAVVLVLVMKSTLLGFFWMPSFFASFPKTPLSYAGVFTYMFGVLLGLYSWQYRSAFANAIRC
ncbi:unnamed protein product [Symbiodinium natans]|uniref:Uncharacterized protein n=1 Tax=Symbiodinium natans TaxID=878477 RepID=A0A812UW62_9DINO|nr:unnamed protein product [Symbiodinium natans]